MASHLQETHGKFFQHFASQGERIGELSGQLDALEKQHQQMQKDYSDKQRALFAKKDPSKWENPEVSRMTRADQEELLRDPTSASLIAPQDQQNMWKVK